MIHLHPLRCAAVFAAILASPMPSTAQTTDSATGPRVTLQAFADAFYAWDAGRPPLRDRVLTTQAARHSEFNVNLAHLGLRFEDARVRGRVAVQAGTSVQANYAGEPTVGLTSGPALSRFVQEATAGVRLAPTVWVDAGIYFSPIGHEGWISADNPTYTRSLTAEYTPYYLSGVRLSWQAAPALALQAHLVNGWQKISDDDEGKAVVVRADYTTGTTTVSFSAFAGAERAATDIASGEPAARAFGQLLLKSRVRPATTLWLTADAGRQARTGRSAATWGSLTAIAQQQLSSFTSIALRGERYMDRDGALLNFDGSGSTVTGLSANADLRLPGGAIWRTEAKWQRANRAIFPDRTGTRQTNLLLVTSLALAFDQVVRGPTAP